LSAAGLMPSGYLERSSAQEVATDQHGWKRFKSAKSGQVRGRVFGLDPGRITELRFEIKGKEYFLAFVEDERRWFVFSATPQGLERIPVYVDGPESPSNMHRDQQEVTN
jgi:hypothetical protein